MIDKILSLDSLSIKIDSLKNEGKTVALCHGCFDVLHFGHLRHFSEAKKKCDYLVVTVTPNKFVNKGDDRPIFSENYRLELLSGLSVIDYLALNKWDSAVDTLKLLKPDFFVKGSEYEAIDQSVNPLFNIEKETIQSIGGSMLFTYEETSSSTEIIEKIKKL
tara:strand:+ start:283 stop:768 length:486 start_codon:yes stop_codon:yes gene_type:complete